MLIISGLSKVVGKRLYHVREDSCQQMRYKITEPLEFLNRYRFLVRQLSTSTDSEPPQLLHLGKGETSRSLAT